MHEYQARNPWPLIRHYAKSLAPRGYPQFEHEEVGRRDLHLEGGSTDISHVASVVMQPHGVKMRSVRAAFLRTEFTSDAIPRERTFACILWRPASARYSHKQDHVSETQSASGSTMRPRSILILHCRSPDLILQRAHDAGRPVDCGVVQP